MSAAVPRRVTVVFAGLVIATGVTWWLGSGTLRSAATGVAAPLTILIALTKVYFIGNDFMDLRAAPRVLRTVFGVWVAVVAAAGIVLVA